MLIESTHLHQERHRFFVGSSSVRGGNELNLLEFNEGESNESLVSPVFILMSDLLNRNDGLDHLCPDLLTPN